MKVADILAAKGRTVHSILPWATVAEAVSRLDRLGIGALCVCDADHRLVGIISERDLIRGMAAQGPSLLERRVDEIMTRHVVTVPLAETITDAMGRVTRGRHRHLPVVENGALVGMVSIGDLVKHRLHEMELETGVLRDAYIAAH